MSAPLTPPTTTTDRERLAAQVMVAGIRDLLVRIDEETLRQSMLRNYASAEYTATEVVALLCEVTLIAAKSITPPF